MGSVERPAQSIAQKKVLYSIEILRLIQSALGFFSNSNLTHKMVGNRVMPVAQTRKVLRFTNAENSLLSAINPHTLKGLSTSYPQLILYTIKFCSYV